VSMLFALVCAENIDVRKNILFSYSASTEREQNQTEITRCSLIVLFLSLYVMLMLTYPVLSNTHDYAAWIASFQPQILQSMFSTIVDMDIILLLDKRFTEFTVHIKKA
jgi:hypothetical protein